MLDVVVFNVEHGQSIFFYPRSAPAYSMFVDCGNTQDFEPIDRMVSLLPLNQAGRPVLSNLTLTNYDHDHFSGLPYLMSKVHIETVRFAKNLSTPELIALKPERTEALDNVCYIKDTYIHDALHHQPPYTVMTFSLPKYCFPDGQCTTNNLSQIVFVSYEGSVICICGDVEEAGWNQLLLQDNFQAWLRATNVLVAAHHGRENGYAEEIFSHCSPECIIISDKGMAHGTQEGMSQAYATHVIGNGIALSDQQPLFLRKVVTTRSDGHIVLTFSPGGVREYRNFTT